MSRVRVLLAGALAVALLAPPAAASVDRSTRESVGRATIVRDDYGVPHIYAHDRRSLFYAMGYVAADDRLWQAEILRRSATGTLAELLGADAVAGDVQARLMFGPEERRAAAFAAASPELQQIITAYVDGMNALIAEETAAGTLPVEFGAFGVVPRPWTTDDVVAEFMLLGSRFGWFGSDELTNLQTWLALQDRFGADAATVFGDLFWLDDPDAPTTVPSGPAGRPARRADTPHVSFPSTAVRAAREATSRREEAVRAWRDAGVPDQNPASNAFVISPRLSADGRALLLGGPQMGYSTPQINHEVGLHGAGFDVTGMSIAGFPLIPIGVGDGYAWTLTSGGSDNSDIFTETLDPADPTRYRYRGEWRPLDCRVEEFGVAGSGPIAETLCTSVHGPIVGVDGTTAFAFANTTFGHELDSLEAWIGLGTARTIDQFASHLPDVAYNFNVLYADRAGNIAYWHIGFIPIRAAGVNPFFPTAGSGDQDWQGIVPFEDMPHAVNPRQGWMASWNNKPAPGWQNSSADFWLWGPAHRVNTLMGELRKLRPHTADVATVEEINRVAGWTTDTPTGSANSVFVSTYLDEMLRAVDLSADPRLRGVVRDLARWDRMQVDADGDGFYDDPNGTIFNAWWTALAGGVFDEVADLSNRFVLGNLVDRMLRGDDAALPLAYDYLGGESVEEAVTGALVAALDELTATYGSADPADWRQPISTISWSPIGAAGVPDTIWMNRGTYNQIVHLGRRTWAENVVAPGQSGEPTSPHFADQLELYATWTYKPMRLTRADLRGHVESVKVLRVPR